MVAGYVAYIDESGDEGLRRVRPLHLDGSSEWFVISAVLVKIDRDKDLVRWVRAIRSGLKSVQRPDIHFRHLSPQNKRLVCSAMAKLPLRCFAVMSNKKNMQGYRNPFAEQVPARNWFYCWMTRLLLERVTGYCASRTMRDWNEVRTVRFVFSTRGGMSYGQVRAYLFWLRKHSNAGTMFLKRGDLTWSVVDIDDVHAFDHSQRAGLQLADTVASAFYQAVEYWPALKCEPEFAKLLHGRMARSRKGQILEYGLKPMPYLRKAKLIPAQKDVFEFYGFPQTKW
jgi:hypothetical protein